MGSSRRIRPRRLSSKLRQIRETLGLSQTEIGRLIGLDNEFARNYVSGYERDTREPTLDVLLHYSEISGCWMNAIVDDEIDLPEKLPATPKSEGIKRKKSSGTMKN
jgi:transcriptional regulator with XRE-family HTH domain